MAAAPTCGQTSVGPVMAPGVVGNAYIVIVIAFDVAGLPVIHPPRFEVITTVITSPLTRALLVYMLLVAPLIGIAPLYHWYIGVVPPLVGDAVNVTEVPAHTALPGAAAIDTLTGMLASTVRVWNAEAGDPQPVLIV